MSETAAPVASAPVIAESAAARGRRARIALRTVQVLLALSTASRAPCPS